MKHLLIIFLVIFSVTSCKESQQNTAETNKTTVKEKTKATQTKKDSFIKIKFEEGPLKGSHTFAINSEEITSNIGVLVNDEGFIDINGGTLFNSNGDRLSSFNRLIAKELSKGSNAPYAKDCGGMVFHDRNDSNPIYNKIYVNFTACTPTEITNLSSWKDGTPYRQRGVTGNFNDTVTLEVNSDEGETETVTSAVSISFSLIQKEIIQ